MENFYFIGVDVSKKKIFIYSKSRFEAKADKQV